MLRRKVWAWVATSVDFIRGQCGQVLFCKVGGCPELDPIDAAIRDPPPQTPTCSAQRLQQEVRGPVGDAQRHRLVRLRTESALVHAHDLLLTQRQQDDNDDTPTGRHRRRNQSGAFVFRRRQSKSRQHGAVETREPPPPSNQTNNTKQNTEQHTSRTQHINTTTQKRTRRRREPAPPPAPHTSLCTVGPNQREQT